MQYNKRIKRTEQRQLIDELFNLFKQHTRGGIYVLMIDMRCTKYKYIGNMIWYFKRCGIDITRWNFPVLNSTFYDMVVIIGDDMLDDNEKCDDIYDFIGNGMVVKVSSDCNLGSLGSGTGGVPQLPSGNREELRERYYLSFYANTCEIDQFLEAYYESELDCDNVAKCYALEASQLIPEKDLNSLLYEVKISENVFQIIPNYFKNDQLLDTQFEEKATNCLVNNNYKGEFL